MENKKIIMVLPSMSGGGAERVAAQLLNEFKRKGADCTFILTSMSVKDAVNTDLDGDIELISLKDEKNDASVFSKFRYALMFLAATFFCKIYEKLNKKVPAFFAYMSFLSQNHNEIIKLREFLKKDENASVIAFLQPSIPMTMLAARGLSNKVIFSERGDPIRLMKHRYGEKFIEKYYQRADAVVFQTENAENAYPENIAKKGTVISNPIKTGLPDAYHGERNKNITTFCRISPEKGLSYLVDAFFLLHKARPEYKLRIIGDAKNKNEKRVLNDLRIQIEKLKIKDYVSLEPFSKDVHDKIIKDTLYVNCSETEGLSNAMLEAMAIGMPVVCTDCPIGGARATIIDGENGFLVPVKDVEALYKAMIKIIDNEALSEKLSKNASEIRNKLTLESIAEKWMELI